MLLLSCSRLFRRALRRLHCQRRHMQTSQSYVGEKTPLAGEYHDSDFDFKEHEQQVLELLESQRLEPGVPSTAALTKGGQQRATEGNNWETFYQRHPKAKFFKERRYILLEFPDLCIADPPQHFVEIGCGCGSSILPVLRANSTARATVTDISSTSVQQLLDAAQRLDVASTRISSFVVDGADAGVSHLFHGLQADGVLIMFTLSAIVPEKMVVMLQHAYAALRPGGKLYIRDHGLYDMVQLRMPPEAKLGENQYLLQDGTFSYFFSTQDLQQKAAAAGLRTVECKYVCVVNRNKKTGQELRRVFVHGIFCKPTDEELLWQP